MQGDDLLFEEPSPNDVQLLDERLYEFNRAATGIDDGRALGVFVRDHSGNIVGAAAGHTWGGTCELRQVWVAEAQRRAGLGRRLVTAAEAEATRRGCSQLVLMTHSFQAPDFYRKLGFEVISELPDYPRGHAYLLLRKRLA
jgi:ribosomal protein S18 acetylase RimI-like enzyme